MNVSFDGLAFAGFIAAQALAVIAVHGARLEDDGHSSSIASHRNDDSRLCLATKVGDTRTILSYVIVAVGIILLLYVSSGSLETSAADFNSMSIFP
jgi:hypothetical protein